ncbi:sensor histidine kinase [Streptomyces avicenniae]|uniref:sensor histidine kinase n=1 Tax=Streptomyces avicenniae TaxID=500153 RepID=UPI0006995E5A|nr:histidine kinase [Streptomyces avicenniae]
MPPPALIRPFFPEEPGTVPSLREDVLVALGTGTACALTTLLRDPHGQGLDVTGWLLLAGLVLPLIWRRRAPFPVLLLHLAVASVFHGQDYDHVAPFAATAVAVYSVSVAGPRWRTVTMAHALVLIALSIILWRDYEVGMSIFRVSGWILVFMVLGEVMRLHGQYLIAVNERAERAERTREEEAARRVAEERLRIARDLHDLLAHSITVIGVRTSVASHLLTTDPDRLDRYLLAEALDGISETCREARADLRTTLRVLRGDDPGGEGTEGSAPPPGLAGIPELTRTAEEAGARVTLTVGGPEVVPPVVGAAAYRIVQESLTNAVRHAGPGVGVTVSVVGTDSGLRIAVMDDGGAGGGAGAGRGEPTQPPGFGITGMRERARSIGGTLSAVPRQPGRGFAVTAELPVAVGGGEEATEASA